MTKVRCPNSRCIYWDDGFCTAETIELDPETLSCLTVEEIDDLVLEGEGDSWDDGEEDAPEKSALWEEDDIIIESLDDLEEEEWKDDENQF
jgi:hypothetical protein